MRITVRIQKLTLCLQQNLNLIFNFLVEEPGDTSEDREARALLNKFLGASVIMQGVESMLPPTATGQRLNSQGVSLIFAIDIKTPYLILRRFSTLSYPSVHDEKNDLAKISRM